LYYHILRVRAIPTYTVYRLYDSPILSNSDVLLLRKCFVLQMKPKLVGDQFEVPGKTLKL